MANRRSLDPLREEYKDFIKTANERYFMLKNENAQSPALWDAQRTQKEKYVEGFSLDDKKSFREIRREIRRAEAFLNDPTSTKYGVFEAELNKGKEKYRKAFGYQHMEQYGVSYDRSRIDDDKAREAFKVYHQVASEMQELIRKQFGSENLINALYDQVVQRWGSPFDRQEQMEKLRLDIYNYLQETALVKREKAIKARSFDEEYGVLNLSRLKDAKSRADYYVKLADAFSKGNYF